MAGLSQIDHLPEDFTEHLKSFLLKPQIPYTYPVYERYTHGYVDWSAEETWGQCTPFSDNEDGFKVIMKDDNKHVIEGRLFGGCIEIFEMLKGTRYWPKEDFWNDKILFLETSEDKPNPFTVSIMLRNYAIQGIFDKVKAVIFARPKDYNEEEKKALEEYILKILKIEHLF